MDSEMSRLDHPANEKGLFGGGPSKFLTLIVIAIAIGTFHVFVKSRNIADYDAYLYLTDQIYYFYGIDQWIFEPASTAILYIARVMTGSSVVGVAAAQIFLSVLFIVFAAITLRDEKRPAIAMLVFFSFYGPLLAFVTIRATPAYFLVMLAAFQANRGRLSSLALAGAALLFHVSAVLALPPLCMALLQNRFSSMKWLERSAGGFLIVGVIVGAGVYYFLKELTDVLVAVVQVIPFLSKYTVYLTSLISSDISPVTAQGEASRYAHYIYLVIVSVFLAVFFVQKDDDCRKFRAYIITSYVIFLFLQFSPVSAFRQSPFWMMPAIFLFPWFRFSFGGIGTLGLILMCCGIFGMQLSSVIL